MLCVWYDWEGIIYYKLLKGIPMVKTKLYVHKMERLKIAIQEKRCNWQHGVLLMRDNACSHIANMTKEAFET